MIGQVVSNFEIVRRLGRGGMGAVYEAKDLMLDRKVAIKVVHPELGRDAELRQRFQKEARALARLHHPNVTSVHSLFAEEDRLYLVMELVEGQSLQQYLHDQGALDWRQAVQLAVAALEGLAHAHQQGIVHRDIKPSNLMLPAQGGLKLMDFGIAHILGQNRLTRHGSVVGTLAYMAPEQITSREVDPRTDLYSLGIVLYEMVAGRTPFRSDSEYELMRAQVEKLPTPPRTLVADIPPWLERTIIQTLSKNPGERADSANALAAELRRGVGADETLDAGPTRVLVAQGRDGDSTPPTPSGSNPNTGPSAGSGTAAAVIPPPPPAPPLAATRTAPEAVQSGRGNGGTVHTEPVATATVFQGPPTAPQKSRTGWWVALALVLMAGLLLVVGVAWWWLSPGPEETVAETTTVQDPSSVQDPATLPPPIGASPPPPVGSSPSGTLDDTTTGSGGEEPTKPTWIPPQVETPGEGLDGAGLGGGAAETSVGPDGRTQDGPGEVAGSGDPTVADADPPMTEDPASAPPPPALDPTEALLEAGEIARRLCPDLEVFLDRLSDALDDAEDRNQPLTPADRDVEDQLDRVLEASFSLRRAYNVVASREGLEEQGRVLGRIRRLGSATRTTVWERAEETRDEGREAHRLLQQTSVFDGPLRQRWDSLSRDLRRLEAIIP